MSNILTLTEEQAAIDNHNKLVALFKENPIAFDVKRQELINQLIEEAPEHLRAGLKQTQLKLDGLLNTI